MINRKVGTESQKTYLDKLQNGFFTKYMTGCGLDIGYAGYTSGAEAILPTAIGIDKDYPGYDLKTLPFASNTQDYVYNSHCLEHIGDYKQAMQEWFRVLKPKGFMIIVVPHRDLYEKKLKLPSIWNQDHKRFYTPASLLTEIEESLVVNSYRIRFLEDGDKGFDYSTAVEKHSGGQYEITIVLEKL